MELADTHPIGYNCYRNNNTVTTTATVKTIIMIIVMILKNYVRHVLGPFHIGTYLIFKTTLQSRYNFHLLKLNFEFLEVSEIKFLLIFMLLVNDESENCSVMSNSL